MKHAVTMMAALGPRLFNVHTVAGVAITNAKRNPVLSQLIAPWETPKYSDEVLETGEKESHCQASSVKTVVPIRIALKTHVPADDDVQQHQLSKAKKPPFVDFIHGSRLRCCCAFDVPIRFHR